MKCMIVGNPKQYRIGNLEEKHEEMDAESVVSSAKLNGVVYSAEQGLKGNLTRGVVAVLQQPMMQVVTVSLTTRSELKKIGMYKLVLSDGVHTQDATVASQLDHPVKNTRLCRGTIIRLLEFMCSTVQSPSLIVITQLKLQTECELIGSLKSYKLCCVKKPYALESKCGEPYPRAVANPRSVANYSQPMHGPYLNGQSFKGHLTRGAVSAVLEGQMTVEQQPVMQVVDVLLLHRNKYNLRGILLSDGVYQLHGLLLSHLRHLVDDNCLRKGTIVSVLQFVLRSFENSNLIIIFQLEVLQTECELIGSPKSYKLCCIEKPYVLVSKCGVPYSISVANSSQPINQPYLNGQGFKGHLTGGAVAAVLEGEMTLEQRPVMQVVVVLLLDKGMFKPALHFAF